MQIEGVPDGWELVRIGAPNVGEFLVDTHGNATPANAGLVSRNWCVVRKVQRWRPAKPSDLGDGKTQARFRDTEHCPWKHGCLAGFRFQSEFQFQMTNCEYVNTWFRFCEVLEDA